MLGLYQTCNRPLRLIWHVLPPGTDSNQVLPTDWCHCFCSTQVYQLYWFSPKWLIKFDKSAPVVELLCNILSAVLILRYYWWCEDFIICHKGTSFCCLDFLDPGSCSIDSICLFWVIINHRQIILKPHTICTWMQARSISLQRICLVLTLLPHPAFFIFNF